MTDLLVLDLVDKGLVTNQIVLTIGYNIENVSSGRYKAAYEHIEPRRAVQPFCCLNRL